VVQQVSDTVRIRYGPCDCFYGPPRWHGLDVYEPDECGWEGDLEVDAEDLESGYLTVTCPQCGNERELEPDTTPDLWEVIENGGRSEDVAGSLRIVPEDDLDPGEVE